MKAFVTGATGFVGSHVARVLAEQGADLRLLVRSTSDTKNIEDLKADRVIGDLRHPDSLEKGMAGCDVLFHTAAYFREYYQPGDHWKALEEINVKAIEFIDESSPIVRKTATANFKIIGPKFAKMVNAVAKRIKEMSPAEVVQLDQTGTFTTEVNGSPITITRDDVTIAAQSIEGWLVESADGLTVALDTKLTPELINEGLAREFVNRVQNMRKDAGLSVTDRIRVAFDSADRIAEAVLHMAGHIQSETLATAIQRGGLDRASHQEKFEIDGETCDIGISLSMV